MATTELTNPENIINETNDLLTKFYDNLIELNEKGIEYTKSLDEYNKLFEEDASILKAEMKKIVNSVVDNGNI